MKVKILFLSMVLACFLYESARCLRILHENDNGEEDLAPVTSEDEFYQDLPTGPEKLPIEVAELDKKGESKEESEQKNPSEFLVDEETIRNAEKAAEKDLLNGLNRILKNNETLKDILRTENVYEIP